MSRPLLSDATVSCTAPKSLRTKPVKPSCRLRMSVSSGRLLHAYAPLILLKAHIVDPRPASTAAAHGGV